MTKSQGISLDVVRLFGCAFVGWFFGCGFVGWLFGCGFVVSRFGFGWPFCVLKALVQESLFRDLQHVLIVPRFRFLSPYSLQVSGIDSGVHVVPLRCILMGVHADLLLPELGLVLEVSTVGEPENVFQEGTIRNPQAVTLNQNSELSVVCRNMTHYSTEPSERASGSVASGRSLVLSVYFIDSNGA